MTTAVASDKPILEEMQEAIRDLLAAGGIDAKRCDVAISCICRQHVKGVAKYRVPLTRETPIDGLAYLLEELVDAMAYVLHAESKIDDLYGTMIAGILLHVAGLIAEREAKRDEV